MLINISQLTFGLAPGVLGATPRRMGVWVQGCSLPKCPGCASMHTWPREGGTRIRIASLMELAHRQPKAPSNLTISGGEPTDQADAVTALAEAFRSEFPEAEIVLYSGLNWPTLAERHPQLIAALDVAITGPFRQELESTPLTGSRNQDVVLLSNLARDLYQGWEQWPRGVMQIGSGPEGAIITVGVPDTTRMQSAARQSGFEQWSWHTRKSRTND